MTKIRYLIPQDDDSQWEISLYHTNVVVKGGVVETDDQEVIDALCQYHGFEVVHEAPVAATTIEQTLGRGKSARRHAA